MNILDEKLLERIRGLSAAAEERTLGAVRYEEHIALPYFGQIILRFSLGRDTVTLDELDRLECMLYELAGDEFMVDFMGSVYRKAGVDYSNIEARCAALYPRFADEPVPPSIYADGLRRDARDLLRLAGLRGDERVWEIQPDGGEWLLLILGQRSEHIKDVEDFVTLHVAEVPEEPCAALIKAAFYAKRNRISLARLLK